MKAIFSNDRFGIKLLSKEEILKFSREHNGERYVKHFDAYQHLVIMLYAVIKRFD